MINFTGNQRFKVCVSEIDFKKIISASLLHLQPLDSSYKLQVKTVIEGCLPFYSDSGHLQIIFNNLISNAIKFMHSHEPHPVLNIQIEVDSAKATMVFNDNGIGIPKENLAKIFNMFFQTPGNRIAGSGLGLFMVKEIVRKMKGKIRVISLPGEGAKFTIEIPNRIDPDLLRKLNKMIQNS